MLTSTYSAQQLRSAFKGNHMLSSLPALPDRKYLGETHLAPYLIDDRQSALWSTALHSNPFFRCVALPGSCILVWAARGSRIRIASTTVFDRNRARLASA